MSVRDSIAHYNPNLSSDDIDDIEALTAFAKTLGIECKADWGLGKIQIEVFEKTVEDQLKDPTFITAYPTEVSPLSRRNDDNPFVTDQIRAVCGWTRDR